MQVTHVYCSISSLGGVESILRTHLRHDRDYGLESRCLTVFDRTKLPAGATTLGCSGFSSKRIATARFRESMPAREPSLVIYHNLWGIEMFAGVDRAIHRLGYVHTDAGSMLAHVRKWAHLTDGLICSGTSLARLVEKNLPSMDPKRIVDIHYPLEEAAFVQPLKQGALQKPVVLGYSGRLVEEQKQVRQIPVFIEELAKRKIDFRFEFLGDGPEKGFLAKALAPYPHVIFHGRKSGQEYLDVLRQWDFLFLCSAFETGPICALEAMALGTLPICPDIPCMVRPYLQALETRLSYQAGNYSDAADILERCLSLSTKELSQLRTTSWDAVSKHSVANYFHSVSNFLRDISLRPAVHAKWEPQPGLHNTIPFGFLQRMPWLQKL